MVSKIISMGNPLRRDDAVALFAAEKIKKYNIHIAEQSPEAFFSEGDNIVIIDAADFGAEPGAVRMFSGKDAAARMLSTHDALPLLLSLAKDVRIIAIQPSDVSFGEGLSATLQDKFNKIVAEVTSLLDQISSSSA